MGEINEGKGGSGIQDKSRHCFQNRRQVRSILRGGEGKTIPFKSARVPEKLTNFSLSGLRIISWGGMNPDNLGRLFSA